LQLEIRKPLYPHAATPLLKGRETSDIAAPNFRPGRARTCCRLLQFSQEWQDLTADTRKKRRRIIERFRAKRSWLLD